MSTVDKQSSRTITLFCWILGHSESAFAVDVADNQTVYHLKKAIAKENPSVEPVLLLNLWKPREPLAQGRTRTEREAFSQAIEHITLLDSKSDDGSDFELLVESLELSEYWPDTEPSPKSGCIHIIVYVPPSVSETAAVHKHGLDDLDPDEERGKRRKGGECIMSMPNLAQDPSDDICIALLKRFDTIPKKAQDCVSLMEADLLAKLPVEGATFSAISLERSSIAKFLSPDGGELSSVITHALQNSTREVSGQRSEDMLHCPVDMLVRVPLRVMTERVGGMNVQMDRNTKDTGSTMISGCRPDFLLWLGGLLLFVGEEKANAGDDAKEDLQKKILQIDSTFFGEIKFMLCYTVDRSRIQFYAVDGSPKVQDQFVPLTRALDLTNVTDRFKILRAVVNIARIFSTVSDLVPTVVYPLGKWLTYDTSEIFFGPNFVEKKVPVDKLPYTQSGLQARVAFLQSMYEYAKGRRGLLQVCDDLATEGPRIDTRHKYYRVNLATRGVLQRPVTEDVLRGMVKDLVSGLSALHDREFVHCDIRFPNITYDRSRNQYALIDFEHSGLSDLVPDSRLRDWDDATLENGTYKKSSDIYQLGKMLMLEFYQIVISDEGQDFVTKLMGKQMTARESLEHDWIRELH